MASSSSFGKSNSVSRATAARFAKVLGEGGDLGALAFVADGSETGCRELDAFGCCGGALGAAVAFVFAGGGCPWHPLGAASARTTAIPTHHGDSKDEAGREWRLDMRTFAANAIYYVTGGDDEGNFGDAL